MSIQPPQTIRVGIIDDHQNVLESLETGLALSPTIAVVGTWSNLLTFEQDSNAISLDVLLVDLTVGERKGTEVVRLARDVRGAQVVLMSGAAEREAIAQARAAGCVSFLPKGSSLEEVMTAIHRAAASETWFPPRRTVHPGDAG